MVIECLEQTAGRLSEILNVELTDIDCSDTNKSYCTVKLVGKGNKERYVHLERSTFENCRATFKGKKYLLEALSNKQFIRQDIGKMISRLSKRVNIKFSAHSFRHSWASRQILGMKKDIKSVSLYLGHSSTSTTADFYLHGSMSPEEALFRG